jgi:hypothetical protein
MFTRSLHWFLSKNDYKTDQPKCPRLSIVVFPRLWYSDDLNLSSGFRNKSIYQARSAYSAQEFKQTFDAFLQMSRYNFCQTLPF